MQQLISLMAPTIPSLYAQGQADFHFSRHPYFLLMNRISLVFLTQKDSHSPSLVPWYDTVANGRARLQKTTYGHRVMWHTPFQASYTLTCTTAFLVEVPIWALGGIAHPTARGKANRLCSWCGLSLHMQNRMGGQVKGEKAEGDNQESCHLTRTVPLPSLFTFLGYSIT